jgi:uncharacterized membrane protein YjjP (DUF1212 family)
LKRSVTQLAPYSKWIAAAGNAAIAPGVTLLFTVSWQILVITFATGFAMDRLLAWASARRLPPFFSQLAGAAFVHLGGDGCEHFWRPWC